MRSEIYKLQINNLINVSTSWNNSKTKVDNLDVGKLKAVHVDLKKLSDVVNNEAVKNKKIQHTKIKSR